MTFRFASPCRTYPTALDDDEIIDAIGNMGDKPDGNCRIELYFGFFFDGSGNNMYVSQEAGDGSETNIARLWAAFNDDIDPAYSPRQHRFRSYIEGVGTPCLKKIGDTGTGVHAHAGGAAGWGGEGRINWALLAFQDHLHAHFHLGQPFSRPQGEDTVALVRKMSADMSMRIGDIGRLAKAAHMSVEQYQAIKAGSKADITLRAPLSLFTDGPNAYAINRTKPNDAGRKAVLARRNLDLAQALQGFLRQLPKIKKIRVSIFGFSRGATEARVFANWLPDACDPPQSYASVSPPDHTLRLCGIPVQLDFMGLFDTVVSTGLAQSMPAGIWNGHGAWGRRHDLVIPSNVLRCVHMVAAHESRGSFPVDLIDSAGDYEEIVYPGMHSDVGGGYRRGEQGRGETDGDKLSQIPLCDMYRYAVRAGVPLDLHRRPEARKQFVVSGALRQAFNAYVADTAGASASASSIAALVHAHYAAYLRWRRLRLERGPQWLGLTHSVQRARQTEPQEYQDLIDANDEIMDEWRMLEENNSVAQQRSATSVASLAVPTGDPGFDFIGMVLRGDKEAQWLDGIRRIWNTLDPLERGVVQFCDDYIHDSRAAFKPMADEDGVWCERYEENRNLVVELYKRQPLRAPGEFGARPGNTPHITPVNPRAQACDAHQPWIERGGREFYSQWGYLRWRTLYANPTPRDPAPTHSSQQERHRSLQN